jgi:hypothetical protein
MQEAPMLRTLSKLWDHQHWAIGLVDAPVQSFLDQTFRPQIQWFDCPTFAADPFLVEHNGQTCVLYEEFDYRSHKGRISAVEIVDGQFTTIHHRVIEDDVHFSYPFCIHVDGELFCVPEHNGSGHVSAWRCVEFPAKWEYSHKIIDGPFVDPTLFQHDDRWWFACTSQATGANDRLHLFYSRSPFGPWTAHHKNPVRSELNGSRPAGPVFSHNAQLFRPSQDCSKVYGGATVIHRIDQLNPFEFHETEIRRISPFEGTPYTRGTHHLCGLGRLTVVDGCQRVFEAHETRFVLRQWSQKLLRLASRR